MDQAKDYRRQAEEAERKAEKAGTDEERLAFSKIAEGWRRLEEEARRRLARGY